MSSDDLALASPPLDHDRRESLKRPRSDSSDDEPSPEPIGYAQSGVRYGKDSLVCDQSSSRMMPPAPMVARCTQPTMPGSATETTVLALDLTRCVYFSNVVKRSSNTSCHADIVTMPVGLF